MSDSIFFREADLEGHCVVYLRSGEALIVCVEATSRIREAQTTGAKYVEVQDNYGEWLCFKVEEIEACCASSKEAIQRYEEAEQNRLRNRARFDKSLEGDWS